MKTRPLNAALASDIMDNAEVADDDDDEEEDDTDAEEEPELVDTDDDNEEDDSQSQCHNTDAQEESNEESVSYTDFNCRQALKRVDEYVQCVNPSNDKNLAVKVKTDSYVYEMVPETLRHTRRQSSLLQVGQVWANHSW